MLFPIQTYLREGGWPQCIWKHDGQPVQESILQSACLRGAAANVLPQNPMRFYSRQMCEIALSRWYSRWYRVGSALVFLKENMILEFCSNRSCFLICIFLTSNIGKSSLEDDKWRRAASVFYVIHNLGLAVSGWLIVQPEQLGPGDLLSSPPRQIPTKPRTSSDPGWYVVIYLHVKVLLSIHSIHTIQSRNLEFFSIGLYI